MRKRRYILLRTAGITILCMLMLLSCGNQDGVPVDKKSTGDIPETAWNEALQSETVQDDPPQETVQHDTAEKAAPEITIRMAGDILLHDRVAKHAMQEDGSYQFDVIFQNLEEEIREADLAIVNQEVIIAGEELGVSGYPCFNAPFSLGDALVEVGFNVICHGTNHALDKGRKGLLNCLQFWKDEYPEIAVLGINETAGEQDEIYIFEQDGMKVAVLNYTYGTNGIPLPEDMPYAVDLLTRDRVIADIEKAEKMADFTIVCPHWGTEYVLEETSEQERWAQIFLEHGVDLVLGTHPHVIEPIKLIQDEETGRKMLVYYSLGNFVNWTSSSGQGIANRMVGGIADVTIGPDEEGSVEVKDYSVTAVVTHLESQVNGVYTMKLADYSRELALENEIIEQDPAFSKEYCVELCNKVWGDLWK